MSLKCTVQCLAHSGCFVSAPGTLLTAHIHSSPGPDVGCRVGRKSQTQTPALEALAWVNDPGVHPWGLSLGKRDRKHVNEETCFPVADKCRKEKSEGGAWGRVLKGDV